MNIKENGWKDDLAVNIVGLLNQDEAIVNENANKDADVFNTQRDLTAGVVAKSVGLQMLPDRIKEAHVRGEVYQHDLDYFPYSPMTNCCLPDFESMLRDGCKVGNAQLDSPNSINIAVAHIVQIIGSVASSQYGGISIHMVDELLEPYAEKTWQKHMGDAVVYDVPNRMDYAMSKTQKDIYDAMQALEFELNTLTASTGQNPFTSIGFGRATSSVGVAIQKAILDIRMAKMSGSVAIFPKLIFFIEEGVNRSEGDPNYSVKQLALKCASECMYPDIINVKRIKEMTGGVPTPMGCRSILPQWINPETGLEEYYGRMNLGVVTLNLPRIGLESWGDKELFWTIFEERVQIAKEGLVFHIDRIKDASSDNAPILYKEGGFGKRLPSGSDVSELFTNKRATISLGYTGVYEAVSCIYGVDWEKNEEAKEFSIEILRRLQTHADEWKEEYDIWFSVYATPSESLTDKFNRLDTAEFGVVKGITDKDWYTNSFHYDVEKDPTPFEKLDFESVYEPYTMGGNIHYCEYPNIKQNLKALEAVWDYSYDKISYLGTNTPIDRCFECDFSGEFNATAKGYECPTCGNTNPETCDVVKRLCGYLGQPLKRPVIHGRHEEMISRKKHI